MYAVIIRDRWTAVISDTKNMFFYTGKLFAYTTQRATESDCV